MIEIKLSDSGDSFLIIQETLQRMGIANSEKKQLYQSCHIFHKKGKFYIAHFKEMLSLDGKVVDMTIEDIQRRNSITKLLCNWGMCTLATMDVDSIDYVHNFKIISHNDRKEWKLIHKYKIGK